MPTVSPIISSPVDLAARRGVRAMRRDPVVDSLVSPAHGLSPCRAHRTREPGSAWRIAGMKPSRPACSNSSSDSKSPLTYHTTLLRRRYSQLASDREHAALCCEYRAVTSRRSCLSPPARPVTQRPALPSRRHRHSAFPATGSGQLFRRFNITISRAEPDIAPHIPQRDCSDVRTHWMDNYGGCDRCCGW